MCLCVCVCRSKHWFILCHWNATQSYRVVLFRSKWRFLLTQSSFLPCDAMQVRPMPSCGVHPFVRLSITFVNSVKMNKHIFKICSPSGSHTILVFPYHTSWRYSDKNPPNGGVEWRWGRQKLRFPASIWLHCVLWMLRLPGAINTAPPDRGKLWHLLLVVSGRVCWWREMTTKCL